MIVDQKGLQELKVENDIEAIRKVYKDEKNDIRIRVEAASSVFGETKGKDIGSINFLLTILENGKLELCERISELLMSIINDPDASKDAPKIGLEDAQIRTLLRLLTTATGERYKIVNAIFSGLAEDNSSLIERALNRKRHHCSVHPQREYCNVDIKPVKKYFVAHAFTEEKKSEMRRVIKNAIEDLRPDLSPQYADELVGSENILCKICRLIQSTEFGIYDMASISKWWWFSKEPIPNPNVTLELGIAYGFGKKAIVLIRKGEKPISDIAGLERIEYESYKDLEDKIKRVEL